MNELHWYWIYTPYLDAPDHQAESSLKAGYNKVVFKDEAAKIIVHNKYKRCLAMAALWSERIETSTDAENELVALRRYNKWTELANKFKDDRNEPQV